MSLVDWGDNVVEVSSGTEQDQELLIGILRLPDPEDRWLGTVKYVKKLSRYNIELRKSISYTAVVIIIGYQSDMTDGRVKEDSDVRISMNGRTYFTTDEISEMNLAILEGRNVLNNLEK